MRITSRRYFGSGSAVAAVSAPATKTPEAISIAVLPFADTSPKKDQEWLSDGFSEELLVHLANIKELRVVGQRVFDHIRERKGEGAAAEATKTLFGG